MLNYKTILITGGAGFIGSNLAVSFKRKYPGLKIIALDNLKRRGSELNISRLKETGVEFVHGDIRNPEDLHLKLDKAVLIECSAEPSISAGFGDNPAYIINTNLTGTINCLEFCRKAKADMVFLSTSRVYPYGAINRLNIVETATRFDWSARQKEKVFGWSAAGIGVNFGLNGPKTLYGATKLASEFLIQEYIANYRIKGIINRCGVIAGPWQFGKVDQGVFTHWMLAHYFKKTLKYIGFGAKGKQVRDLLHINDLFNLIDLQISKIDSASGNIYNVGGGRGVSLSLLEAAKLCQEITGDRIAIGRDSKNRPGDIAIYLTDNKRVYSAFGWRPQKTAKEILADIYHWIHLNESQIKKAFF